MNGTPAAPRRKKGRLLYFLDRAAFYVSGATLVLLIVQAVWHRLGMAALLPPWVENGLMTVLCAAAVGYLTNWIAILLLFRPYGKHCGFLQGVIPRKRAELGHELGIIIPEYLLRSDDLADQVEALTLDYLQSPDLLGDLRPKVQAVLRKYRLETAALLTPCVAEAVGLACEKLLSPEEFRSLYDKLAAEYLAVEANRLKLARLLAGELQKRVPEFTELLRSEISAGTRQYVRQEWPILSRFLNADEFAARLAENLNWPVIQEQLRSRLGDEETCRVIAGELVNFSDGIRRWLSTPEAAVSIAAFREANRAQMDAFFNAYLERHLPEMTDRWLQNAALWQTLEEQLLPFIRVYLRHKLRRDKAKLVAAFDLPGRIEQSVADMDMRTLHEMIDRAAGEHLVMIQLLGYWLGALVGALQLLAG